MECLIVNDNCETCIYNQHAFLLHGVPTKQISTEVFLKLEYNENTKIIICYNNFSKIQKKINCKKLIIIGNPSEIQNKFPDDALFIKAPYQWSDLFDALNKTHKTCVINNKNSGFEKLAGISQTIVEIKKLVAQVANSDATVLLLGESGSGKDVIASCIHGLSSRKHKPFVPVNCGAIPPDLIESELFGHVKGAFTGALNNKPGRFEVADGGTLFLDEIGDMPMGMQVKLLRVLQDQIIQRVGSNDPHPVNVRIIAATNKNLAELIEKQLFREDLYYRINVFPIKIPSLRERKEDIRSLTEYWLAKIGQRLRKNILISNEAYNCMENYSWPGNIRELQNFLERIVILFPDGIIGKTEVEPYFKAKPNIENTTNTENIPELSDFFDINEYISQVEKSIIQRAIEQSGGIISNAANILNISKSSLTGKLKKHQIEPSEVNG